MAAYHVIATLFSHRPPGLLLLNLATGPATVCPSILESVR